MAVAFASLQSQILLRRPHLLKSKLSLEQRRRILARGVSGLLPYVIATAVAAVSAYATLAICAALAAFYALPIPVAPRRRGSNPATRRRVRGASCPRRSPRPRAP